MRARLASSKAKHCTVDSVTVSLFVPVRSLINIYICTLHIWLHKSDSNPLTNLILRRLVY